MDDLGAYVGGLVRSAIIAAGTWAVATGYFTDESWGTVAAAGGVLFAVGWSMVSKYMTSKKTSA